MSPRAQWNKVKKHHHKKNKKIENGEHQAELQQLISGLNVNAEHHDIPSAPCAVLGTVVVESGTECQAVPLGCRVTMGTPTCSMSSPCIPCLPLLAVYN